MSTLVIDFCRLGVFPKAIKYLIVFSKFGELILMSLQEDIKEDSSAYC